MTDVDPTYEELIREVDRLRLRVAELEERTLDRATVETQREPMEGILRFVRNEIPAYIAFVDSQGRFRYANHRYADQFGFSPDQLLGMHVRDVIGGAAYERSKLHIQSALEGNEQHFENHVSRLNGEKTWFDLRYIPDLTSDSTINGFFCLAVDITEQKHSECAVRESEARFRAFFEQAAVGVALIDATTGRFRRVNKKFEDLIGCSDQQLKQKTFEEYAHSEDLREHLEKIRQLQNGAVREVSQETRLVRGDGSTICCSVTVSPAWDATEGPDCYIAIFQDVSRQKETEQALLESEKIFRTLVEHSYDVINLFSSEGELLFTSPSIKRVLGYEPQELIGTRGPVLVHPDDLHDAIEAFAEFADRPGATGRFVHRLRHKDGTYRTVEVTGTNLLHEPGINAMVSIFHDVTDRIRAEEDLRQSERRYRTLIENAPDAIMVLDPQQGRFVDFNENAVKLFGYSREEVSELHPRQLSAAVQPDGRTLDGEFENLLPKVMAGEQATLEWLHRRADGTEFPTEVRLMLLPTTEGVRIRGSIVDVSHRKQQEERFREQELALAHASRLGILGEMVAGIAHEINQPLSAISTFAGACSSGLAVSDYKAAFPIEEWLGQIADQALRCGDIIRRLRRFVKKNEADRDRVDLNEIVDDSIALLNSDIRHTSISTEWSPPAAARFVIANKVELQQVLVNLLRNAYESVGTSDAADRQILVYGGDSDDAVQLTVEDHGQGIDKVDVARLFDAFFTTKAEGMGLGLAISRSIVEAHGGRLWAEPCSPHGAKFHVELPLANEPAHVG